MGGGSGRFGPGVAGEGWCEGAGGIGALSLGCEGSQTVSPRILDRLPADSGCTLIFANTAVRCQRGTGGLGSHRADVILLSQKGCYSVRSTAATGSQTADG